MAKVVVAGGRDFGNPKYYGKSTCENHWFQLRDALCLLLRPGDVVISGDAPGADSLAVRWALKQSELVGLLRMPADWDQYGKAAGAIRNQTMSLEGDALIAFWDGRSKGTKDMIEKMTRKGGHVHIYRYIPKGGR